MARGGLIVQRGKRMQAAWSTVLVNSRANSIGSGASTLGGVGNGAQFSERVTITRIRGTAFAHMDAGAAADCGELGLGLIIVKSEAFAAGAASMPAPISEIEQSWIWHHIFTFGPAVLATDDPGDISRNDRVVIDSKAQRKVQSGDLLGFVWEWTANAGTPTADGYAAIRFMVKLS